MESVKIISILLVLFALGCLSGDGVEEYKVFGLIYDLPEAGEVLMGGHKNAHIVMTRMMHGKGFSVQEYPLVGEYSREGADAVASLLDDIEYLPYTPSQDFTQRNLYYGSWDSLSGIVRLAKTPDAPPPESLPLALLDAEYLADVWMEDIAERIHNENPDLIIGQNEASTVAVCRAARKKTNEKTALIIFDSHIDTYQDKDAMEKDESGHMRVNSRWAIGSCITEGSADYAVIIGPSIDYLHQFSYLPQTAEQIDVIAMEELEEGDVNALMEEVFITLENKGIGSIVVSIDLDVLDRNDYSGFRYNKHHYLIEHAYRYYHGGTIEKEDIDEKLDLSGVSPVLIYESLEVIYVQTENNDLEILYQQITEANHYLDIDGKTTRLSADLAKYMLTRSRDLENH